MFTSRRISLLSMYTINILDKLTVNLTAKELLKFHDDLTQFLNDNYHNLTKELEDELDTITKAKDF